MRTGRIRVTQLCSWAMLALAALAVGCGSGGDGGSGATAQPGTVSVSLTDAPACGYEAVYVTVSKVRIHQSGNADEHSPGWSDITLNPPQSINLLDLNDPTRINYALITLGQMPLGAGHYTQVRLVLEDNNGNQPTANWIVLEGQNPNNPNNRIPLETPSAIRSGIKLVNQFTVASGQRVDLLLDFDACHSIVRTGSGKYQLKPVIKVIPYALNGIEGFVDKASFANQSLVGKNVVASAQFGGEIVRSTVVNTDTGKFFLAHLDPAKDYVVVLSADDHATAVINNVPVDPAPAITTISTSNAPFALASSSMQAVNGTVTLNPPDDDGTVIVAAKQTLNSGPTVTVKSAIATVFDAANPVGDYGYTLTLPTASPSLGQYATPLPITLSATVPSQASVAKVYTLRGSAQVVTPTGTTVYATQNPPASAKDVTANPTQNFTLSAP